MVFDYTDKNKIEIFAVALKCPKKEIWRSLFDYIFNLGKEGNLTRIANEVFWLKITDDFLGNRSCSVREFGTNCKFFIKVLVIVVFMFYYI